MPYPRHWLQLKMELADLDPDTVEEALHMAGATAVTLEDGADAPLYEPAPGETPLWPVTRITGLFEGDAAMDVVSATLRDALSLDTLPSHEIIELGERDWASAWLRDFKPLHFGGRLWVVPGGQAPPDPDACNVLLDPGLAFGTGTHATTALCLEWLAADDALAGARLVDYGCGSGILAIAAVLLGAREVLAVDNDPQALQATHANAMHNGVGDRIQVYAPDQVPRGQAVERLVANILAAPLVSLAPRLRSLLADGGRIALSGLLENQAEAVSAAYSGWCELEAPVAMDGWVRLDGRKVN